MEENKILDVGFQNLVVFDKVLTICNPDSAPIKRFVKQAKQDNRFIDLTEGKKKRSIIIQDSSVGLIAIATYRMPQTLMTRLKEV